MQRRIFIEQADFDVGRVYEAMQEAHRGSAGAIVTFVGLVRDHNQGTGDASAVSTLTLEHYPGMTERSIEDILDQAEARWPLLEIQVFHRVGRLAPADQIVLVAVASGHRDAAFAAAEFVMDYLKTNAVFWKKEETAGGSHWVQSTALDHDRADLWRERAGDQSAETGQ